MTDDQIAELLGWPKGRAHRDSSLMHRIRIVAAEAQAEQDAQIYRLREHADMPAQAQPLRLPEPLTDEEVDALIDETGHMTTDRAVRYLVETGERRVKEVNE